MKGLEGEAALQPFGIVFEGTGAVIGHGEGPAVASSHDDAQAVHGQICSRQGILSLALSFLLGIQHLFDR